MVTAVIAIAILWAVPAAAPAAGPGKPVYLVHGYGTPKNCATGWRSAIATWREGGWTGTAHTVAYYAGDRDCNTRIGSFSRETSIRELGRRLAWDIHERYSRHGAAVDIVGHSMGGLVARVALAGAEHGWDGFPPFLSVEDAVTVGTPHMGVTAPWVDDCGDRQCRQMHPDSYFLSVLARPENQDPQSRRRTDWTLLGAQDDETVSAESALGMAAAHTVVYDGGQDVTHRGLVTISGGDRTYHLSYWNNWHTDGSHHSTRGRSPLHAAKNAFAFSTRW
jgi:pimeloyl-ACP methyl ester carboxylesterase